MDSPPLGLQRMGCGLLSINDRTDWSQVQQNMRFYYLLITDDK